MASIIFTLLLSWRLEGGGAAINDAGSLRMQSYRLGLLLSRHYPEEEVAHKIQEFDTTLNNLEIGDPARPLFLPGTPEVLQQMAELKYHWHQQIKPALQISLQQQTTFDETHLQNFVTSIDSLVLAIEAVNTRYTYWLRLFQSGLIAMVLIGASVMVVLLYLWIIRPLDELQEGVQNIHDGKLGIQVPINKLTEFAQLDRGFNQMSSRLQQLYSNLEDEVIKKTHDLAEKNYTLKTLYSFSRLLNQTQTAAEAGNMFLERIMRLIPAQAGSIRLIDTKRRRIDLIAHHGLPDNLQNAEACQKLEDCFCGQRVKQNNWQPIYLSNEGKPPHPVTECEKSGFHYLEIFKIRYNQQDLGVMTLYFNQEYTFTTNTTGLMSALCNLLGLVLTNIRLADESRQLAVLQERNLIAQGLHDSIAQTLTFLNLQVQMLESALTTQNQEQISENLQFIKSGVQECYEDVRELLLNFRTKISRKEFADAVHILVERFEQQTQTSVQIEWHGDGPNLSSEQQLQFIFILQESLSNIRKHAQATKVCLTFDNRNDFIMAITDNGKGFDTISLKALPENHVGLQIMQERARRIHAQLKLDSQPNQYTKISLILPKQERILI
ncbi:type IV pili methyl-accepting chemotaxis transducer N-terminal domain-containing protein [Neisseria montereyensis]|uniref:Sensor protein n=1 Tax=Neisseria montereyensis TaxID=2973938 RepID=A0ABT2FBB6_9NEIS|nr:type IV pili methyl-accepting chemotaxis transducer N-terminal domain-containing protein [Neisseria montereyensis]MCS4533452.1 type IV pili methyl-accepting chemotaxis transducer N-terminal domain-containing protein [Neisseria montereyensis]